MGRKTQVSNKRGCDLCIADADEDSAQVIISTAPCGYVRPRCTNYPDAHLSQGVEIILSQKW